MFVCIYICDNDDHSDREKESLRMCIRWYYGGEVELQGTCVGMLCVYDTHVVFNIVCIILT
jgi:hypothetical protein